MKPDTEFTEKKQELELQKVDLERKTFLVFVLADKRLSGRGMTKRGCVEGCEEKISEICRAGRYNEVLVNIS